MNKKLLLIALISLALTACKSVQIPSLFNKGSKELPRYGLDAVHYQCANGQSFGLRMSATGDEAWLMLPDHEINLVKDATDKSLYHYNTINLRLNGDNTTLDEVDHLHYKECRPITMGR